MAYSTVRKWPRSQGFLETLSQQRGELGEKAGPSFLRDPGKQGNVEAAALLRLFNVLTLAHRFVIVMDQEPKPLSEAPGVRTPVALGR